VRDHREEFRVVLMCRVLQVSRSGYYAWLERGQSARARSNEELLREIRRVHVQSRRTYGSPRITDELRALGHVCNEKRVARLMRRAGIRPKTVKKFRVTTDSKHKYPVADNLLNRDFRADRADQVWLSDITYIWTSEGWLYLAGIMDLYSRRIVGCAMSSRINADLALKALGQALGRRHPRERLIHHSDQGRQYASDDYRKLLTEHGLISSMSRKGDCWDNAPMESFWGTLKQELVYHVHFLTKEEAKLKIFEYIEVFYNGQRRHSSLGSLSPAEFERLTSPNKHVLY
jgi:putative transposase